MKLRLLQRTMLLVLLPVIVTLTALSFFSHFSAERALQAQIDSDMQIIIAQQRREYSKFHSDFQSLTVMLASRPEMLNALTSTDAMDAAKSVFSNMDRLYSYIQFAQLLRRDGSIVLSQGSTQSFAKYENSKLLTSLQSGSTGIELFQKPNSQELLLAVGAPVRQGNDVVGMVVLSVPLPALGEMYSDQIRVGGTGKCFVLDEKGVVLLDPTDKASIGMNISDISWIRTMLNNASGVIKYEWAGVPKTCFFQRVPELNWVVALGFTDADLLAPVYSMRNNALLMSIVALIILATIVYFTSNGIARPVRDASRFVLQVGSGDMHILPELQREMERSSHRADEIGDLSRGVLSMFAHLKQLFKSTEESMQAATTATAEATEATHRAEKALLQAENARHEGVLAVTDRMEGISLKLSNFAGQLRDRITRSELGARNQAARVSETATAMEEMNSTVLEVAKNASAASEVSAGTRQKAENGVAVVRTAVKSIQQVQTQSAKLKEDMVQLDESARAIDRIMGVISDIADQTNLLALNAAIEAARAGDAGRGFAVVADEVRKLAEKTMASTTDVGNAIRNIQRSATQSMGQVDSAGKSIEEATGFVMQSGEALTEIVSLIDSTADQVRAIATASEEQSASSEEINQSIAEVNSIATETAEAMLEAADAVNELTRQAHELDKLIQEMKRK